MISELKPMLLHEHVFHLPIDPRYLHLRNLRAATVSLSVEVVLIVVGDIALNVLVSSIFSIASINGRLGFDIIGNMSSKL